MRTTISNTLDIYRTLILVIALALSLTLIRVPAEAASCFNESCEIQAFESYQNCPNDCPGQCGDNICLPSSGENFFNCQPDCRRLRCWDGVCRPEGGEKIQTC